jgi:hypothetical protein
MPKPQDKKFVKKPVSDSDSEASEEVNPKGKAAIGGKRKASTDIKKAAPVQKKAPAHNAESSDDDSGSDAPAPKKDVPAKGKKVVDSDAESSEDEQPQRKGSVTRAAAKAQSGENDGVETELFVGSLPFSADDSSLTERFGKYGQVNFVKMLVND